MVSLSVKIIVRFDNLPCFLSRIHVFKKCKVMLVNRAFFHQRIKVNDALPVLTTHQ